MAPVKAMRYNPVYDIVLSADSKGLLEYWSPDSLNFPDHRFVLSSLHIFMLWYSVWYKKKVKVVSMGFNSVSMWL
jgi:hypothetical protein